MKRRDGIDGIEAATQPQEPWRSDSKQEKAAREKREKLVMDFEKKRKQKQASQ